MNYFKIEIVGETPLSDEQIGKCLGYLSAFVEFGMNGECGISYTPIDEQGEPIKDRLNEETKQAIKDSFDHPERGKRFSSIEEAFAWLNSDEEDIPISCRNCSNHPSNGGSGVCHCTLGTIEIR